MPKYILTIGILLCQMAAPITAQDFSWWNDINNWDGTTHWSKYLTYSPSFLGPNALPVPDVKDGSIPESFVRIDLSSKHLSGENTQDINVEAFYELMPSRVGIHAYGIIYERYSFDEVVRDMRRARDFDGEGYGSGDVYLGTWIKLGPQRSDWNAVTSFTIKTASGSNREAARFTDSPGYFMDLSVGRSFGFTDWKLKLFGMIGFYVWQTNEDVNPQNDAFLYGFGAKINNNKIELNTSLGGYNGYKNNGDRPIIIRNKLHYKLNQKNFLEIGLDIGLRDYRYTTGHLSFGKSFNN